MSGSLLQFIDFLIILQTPAYSAGVRYALGLAMLMALLSSCATSSDILRPRFQSIAIHEIPCAPPVAQVAKIQRGNQPEFHREASAGSMRLMRELLVKHQSELHVRGELTVPDSPQQQARQEICRAVSGIEKRQRLDTGAHLPVSDYLLVGQNQRYLLVTATRGFTRLESNYQQPTDQNHWGKPTDYENDGASSNQGQVRHLLVYLRQSAESHRVLQPYTAARRT